MSAVKHAFQKIGHGIEDIGKSIGKDLKGVGNIIGGCITLTPSEIKNGFSEVGQGLKQGVSGLGEAAGGAAGGFAGMTPLGAGINALTHNALSNLCEDLGKTCANTINSGIDGVGQFAKGVGTGNFKEMLSGAMNVGQLAMLAVPGAGEAGSLALSAGKELLKDSVQQEVLKHV